MTKKKAKLKSLYGSKLLARAPESLGEGLANYVTTKQAAEMLGVGQNQIRSLLAKQKVQGIKLGHDWIVFSPSVEKYLRTKSSRGRPSSKEPVLQMAD